MDYSQQINSITNGGWPADRSPAFLTRHALVLDRNPAPVPIETISIGDRVVALDLESGMTGIFTVTAAFSHKVASLLEVVVGGDLIRVTDEHPFWVVGEGWVGAEDLDTGDCVYQSSGSCQLVAGVREILVDTHVYNFTVAEAHTYFVGDGQWLVHNQCNFGFQKLAGSTGRDVLTKGFHFDSSIGELSVQAVRSGDDFDWLVTHAGTDILVNDKIAAGAVDHLMNNREKTLEIARGIISNWAHDPRYANRVEQARLIIQALGGE